MKSVIQKQSKARVLALLSGAIFVASSLSASGAQAKVSSKDYKNGAIALGVLGAILAAKGKTVPAVIAGAGAYYAYKKSRDTRDQYAYNDNNDNRYNDASADNNYNDKADNENVYNENVYNNSGENRRDENNVYNAGNSVSNDNVYDENDNVFNNSDNRYDDNENVYPDAAAIARAQNETTFDAQNATNESDAEVSLD